MTKKEQLMQIFTDMKDIVNNFQTEVKKIRNNPNYSTAYKDQKVTDLRDEWAAPRVMELRNRAIELIAAAKRDLETKWTAGTAGKLSDAGYQTGLANVLQMLRLNAIPAAGLPAVIEVYKDDANAINAIRAIVDGYEEHRKKEFLPLIPHDPRTATGKILDQVVVEIDTMLNMNQLYSDNFAMGFGLRKKYIYEALNDDLSA